MDETIQQAIFEDLDQSFFVVCIGMMILEICKKYNLSRQEGSKVLANWLLGYSARPEEEEEE